MLNPENLPVVESLEELVQDAERKPKARFALRLAYDAALKKDGPAALAATPALAQVAALELSSCQLDAGRLGTLLASEHLGAITCLDLSNNYSHDAGAKVLAAWEGLAKITHLSLTRTGLGGKGVKNLCLSPHLSALQHLDLSSNNINAAGVKALAASSLATQLGFLALRSNPLKDAGVKALESLAGVNPVLDLRFVEMTKTGLKALLNNPALAELVELSVSGNKVTDAGAALLLKVGLPSGVKRLGFANTALTDAGASTLDHAALAQLAWLEVRQYSALSSQTVAALRASAHVGKAVRAGIAHPPPE